MKNFIKQLRGTAIGTKFAPPYAVLLMADLAERILQDTGLPQHIQWRYIDDIFFISEHGENYLIQFIETVNAFHSTLKFSTEQSREEINFLDVTVGLRNRQL